MNVERAIIALGLAVLLAVLPSCGRSEKTGADGNAAKDLVLDLGNNVTMKLVLIPAGKFIMGSPAAEKDRWDNEGPQREVTISKPFYMGVYTVTQEQYRQVLGVNPSQFGGAQYPVETVSWDDAMEFCKKLSQKTGKTVRLPTEAQWEYACRAGSKTRFSYGDDDDYGKLDDYAWYRVDISVQVAGTTHPVGLKKPNNWSLYDMHGNVHQWCSDWYADSYANAVKTDPTGPASGSSRVLRGGSWYFHPNVCRSATRFGRNPGSRNYLIGFRVSVEAK